MEGIDRRAPVPLSACESVSTTSRRRGVCQHQSVKVVFAAIPAYGHLYPLMPLALACARASHDVTVACGAPFVGRLPLPTIAQQPPEVDLEWGFDEAKRRNPGLHGSDLTVGFFADVVAEAVTSALLPALEDLRPDLVVYEAMNAGAGVAADVLDIPSVAYAIGLTHEGPAMVHPATVAYRQDLWTARGLPPPKQRPLLSHHLLDPRPPSLHGFSTPLDVVAIPIRPVPYAEESGVLPSWLEAPKARPRVYLTLGTVAFGAVDVLKRAIDEIASLDVDLLVAVGPDGDPRTLGNLPGHVHVERFVDQSRVLPLVDVVVHHGGTGSVLGALAAGLPQVLLPQGADQFTNADLLVAVRAGRALRHDQHEPGAVRRAVSDLLAEDAEQDVARMLQAEIAELPAPAEVLAQLADVAHTTPTGTA
jgi:UDP:flavonoid glycosyltransferase YjiC (YdhE family)